MLFFIVIGAENTQNETPGILKICEKKIFVLIYAMVLLRFIYKTKYIRVYVRHPCKLFLFRQDRRVKHKEIISRCMKTDVGFVVVPTDWSCSFFFLLTKHGSSLFVRFVIRPFFRYKAF